jgi:predicted metal-binding membrane protein
MELQTQPSPTPFLLACATLFVLAAAGTVYFCRTMSGGMDMPGGWTMSMAWMPMPGCGWIASGAMFLLMWLAMMVAMMLPSTLPMLLKLRLSSARTEHHNFEARALFAAAGYFLIWILIGIVVYALGVAFAIATMRMLWLSRLTPALSGAALIIAGIIQFTPWKMSALQRCRASDCDTTFTCDALKGSWRYGLKQGVACAICCAAPMLVLLVLGVMNHIAMTVIAVVITVEKLLPRPEATVRLFGAVAFVLGLSILLRSAFIYLG